MTANSIRKALSCGRPGCECNHGKKFHCPGHDDTHPSFSVTEGSGGKLLVRCHAGCDQVAVIEALGNLGLWPQSGQNKYKWERRNKGAQIRYEIRNLYGHLIAVHQRKDSPDGKRMWWEQPDGKKGLGGLRLEDLPLYRSESLRDLSDGVTVVITEGEKAADAVRSKGLNAVGTVTGASSTPGNGPLNPLAQLAVVLWPDGDDDGHQHMARLAVRLAVLGCQSIRWLEWPEAPDKGDAADAVAQGVDVAAMIEVATPLESPGAVDLAQLLDDTVVFHRRYLVLTDEQLWISALWDAHTHAIEAAEATAYLAVRSVEKRSGKTLFLEVHSLLVARPWFTGRVTAAVLVRKLARDKSTLLLDETDAAFKGDKEYSEALRGILNSGYRRGGMVSLCVKAGGDYDLRDFPVFGAKALAGIGKLPDTIADRSIPLEMRRKTPDEHTERFRQREAEESAVEIRERLEKWAVLAVPALEEARPDIPQELGDRAADVWEPLLAIADMAGGEWPERARGAAMALSVETVREDYSLGVALLRDIKDVFQGGDVDRLSSTSIVEVLLAREESPWGDLGDKELDARRLARMLKPYGIRPKQMRIGSETMKGYKFSDFRDSWERYIPETSETKETEMASSFNLDGPNVSNVSLVSIPGVNPDNDEEYGEL